MGTDYFSYAMAHNWGGGSESYYYGIPMNVWTFTFGVTQSTSGTIGKGTE